MKLMSLIVVAILLGAACPRSVDAADAAIPAEPASSTRDELRGRLLFMQCRACHATSANDGEKIGPSLEGIFGQPAASVAGYDRYSAPLRNAQFVWTNTTMDEWLKSPAVMVPGNLMAYGGMANAEDRRKLIAYLRKITSTAEN